MSTITKAHTVAGSHLAFVSKRLRKTVFTV